MTSSRVIPFVLFLSLISACATTTTTSTTWGETQDNWARYGRVTWVREYIQHEHGDPAGGAIAGAIIGGILGGGRGPGALVGAVGGAAIGAAASQGSSESRFYDVAIQFEDGSTQVFRYHGYPPFNPGENVVQTPQGLSRV